MNGVGTGLILIGLGGLLAGMEFLAARATGGPLVRRRGLAAYSFPVGMGIVVVGAGMVVISLITLVI